MIIVRRIVFFLFVFFSFSVYAQENPFLQEIALGINGGCNFSKVSFLHNSQAEKAELGDINLWMGLKGGVAVRYISAKHFGVQLEINYATGGWNEKFQPVNGNKVYLKSPSLPEGIDFTNVNMSRRLDYIDIPLLAHIYYGNRVRFFVNLGPKLGILVSYQELKHNMTAEQIAVFSQDDPRIYDKGYRSFDYGLSVGGGLNFQIGRLHAIIEGRYTFGFGDVYNNSKGDVYQRSNNQNVAISIAVLRPVKNFYGN